MSYCKEIGKDKIIFVTREDHAEPSTVQLSEEEDDKPPGLIMPNGDINWNCPCLGGMATGPCGVEFREAFSCFHYSESEPKGSECFEKFSEMQQCMTKYPTLYGKLSEPDDEEEEVFDVQNDDADSTLESGSGDAVEAASGAIEAKTGGK